MQLINFSQKLRELREKENLTQKELASKLYVSDKVISKWETGASYPSIDNIVNIADFFNVDIDYLIDDYDLAKSIIRKTEKKGVRKRKLPYGWLNGLIDILAFGLIIFMFVEILIKYESLPQIIGTHFNILGEADGYGSKNTLFLSPCIALALASLMTIFNFVRIRWYINLGLPVPIESFAVNEQHTLFIFKVVSIAWSLMKLFLVVWLFGTHITMLKQSSYGFILFIIALTLFIATPIIAIVICNIKGKNLKKQVQNTEEETTADKNINDNNLIKEENKNTINDNSVEKADNNNE